MKLFKHINIPKIIGKYGFILNKNPPIAVTIKVDNEYIRDALVLYLIYSFSLFWYTKLLFNTTESTHLSTNPNSYKISPAIIKYILFDIVYKMDDIKNANEPSLIELILPIFFIILWKNK